MSRSGSRQLPKNSPTPKNPVNLTTLSALKKGHDAMTLRVKQIMSVARPECFPVNYRVDTSREDDLRGLCTERARRDPEDNSSKVRQVPSMNKIHILNLFTAARDSDTESVGSARSAGKRQFRVGSPTPSESNGTISRRSILKRDTSPGADSFRPWEKGVVPRTTMATRSRQSLKNQLSVEQPPVRRKSLDRASAHHNVFGNMKNLQSKEDFPGAHRVIFTRLRSGESIHRIESSAPPVPPPPRRRSQLNRSHSPVDHNIFGSETFMASQRRELSPFKIPAAHSAHSTLQDSTTKYFLHQPSPRMQNILSWN